MNKYEINTTFDYFTYVAAVEDIALYFFNTEGKYQPHIGKISAMRVFYNMCVGDNPYREELGDEIMNLVSMDKLVKDEEFIVEFNKALNPHAVVAFDFAHAYQDAMEIVKSRQTMLGSAIELVGDMLIAFVEKMNEAVSPENLKETGLIAQALEDKGVTAETLINAAADRIIDLKAAEKANK